MTADWLHADFAFTSVTYETFVVYQHQLTISLICTAICRQQTDITNHRHTRQIRHLSVKVDGSSSRQDIGIADGKIANEVERRLANFVDVFRSRRDKTSRNKWLHTIWLTTTLALKWKQILNMTVWHSKIVTVTWLLFEQLRPRVRFNSCGRQA